MKKVIAKRWARALRSKKYKQAKGCLKVTSRTGVDRHCCLGILCEMYQNDQRRNKKQSMAVSVVPAWTVLVYPRQPKTSVVTGFGRNKEQQMLPACVQRWAGISINGCFNLTELNDNGMPFTKIADLIEERAAKL